MIHCKFFSTETEIFLLLSDETTLYLTFMNTKTKFFEKTSKIILKNSSLIQNFDGVALGSNSEQMFVVIGHYDGLYSFVTNYKEEFMEVNLNISNFNNSTPFQNSAVLQVFIDTSTFKFCTSHANGSVNIFEVNFSSQINVNFETSLLTNNLPMDLFLYDKTLIVGTKGKIQVYGGNEFGSMKMYSTLSDALICSILILKEKTSGYSVYFGDEKGTIYEMSQKDKSKHEVIEIVGELNSFIVGCGENRSSGKIFFYDRLNSCIFV
jgi:hypothetical protein